MTDAFRAVYADDLGVAIPHTAVVDESGNAAFLGGVDDAALVYSEEIAAVDPTQAVFVLCPRVDRRPPAWPSHRRTRRSFHWLGCVQESTDPQALPQGRGLGMM